MIRRMTVLFVTAAICLATASGCSRDMLGGAALGAAGAGAAYEYQNKRQMDRLEADFKAGRISKEEYYQRKEDIKRGSIIY